MRKNGLAVLLAAGLCAILAVHCGDDDITGDNTIFRGILGQWQWEKSCGGYTGGCIYADSVDYVVYVSFSADSVYRRVIDDSLVFEAKFHVTRDKLPNNDSADFLEIEDYFIRTVIEGLTEDSLILADYCIDCYTSCYSRRHP